MSRLGNPFTKAENSPSCLTFFPPVEIDLNGQLNSVTSGDIALLPEFEYYIMYSEQPIRDRFVFTIGNFEADNFISVVREIATNEWRIVVNRDSALNGKPFIPVNTDVLISQTVDVGIHALLTDGEINGIRTVANAGGLTILDNTFRGVANVGEFGLEGVFSIASSGRVDAALQADGTYLTEDGLTSYTLAELVDLQATPCDAIEATCEGYDATNDLVQYAQLQVGFAGVGEVGHIAVAPTNNVAYGGMAVGESVQVPLQYVGLGGRLIDVTLTITNVSGTNHPINHLSTTGGFGHNGAGRYRLEFESNTFDYLGNQLPFSLAIRPTSFQVSAERWWADGTSTDGLGLSPVDVYLNSNGIPVTYPETGIFGTGGSDQNARIIGYRNTIKVTAEWNSSAVAGSSITTYLYEGPEVVQLPVCALIDRLDQRINALEVPQGVVADTFSELVESNVAFTTTNGVGVAIGERFIQFPSGDTAAFNIEEDLASTEIGNLRIVGDDGEDYVMPLRSVVCYEDTSDSTIEVRAYSDGESTKHIYFDSAGLPQELTDAELAATGWTEVSCIVDEVDERLTALEDKPLIELVTTTLPLYEYRDIWAEESGGLNANSGEWSFGNGAVGFMGLPIDAGWEVEAMYFQADTYPSTATIQLDLMNYGNTPSNAAANTISSISLTDATDGGGQINNAYKYELLGTPVEIPVTGTSTVIGFITRALTGAVSDARVGARLRRKIGEYVTSVEYAGQAEAEDFGTPAGATLVSDFFADGNGNTPFNLQVRNATNSPTSWTAVVRAVPYAIIPNLNAGAYTLSTTNNGDGTYTHVFTGTSQLGAFANITITGGVPVPSGTGTVSGNPELYI